MNTLRSPGPVVSGEIVLGLFRIVVGALFVMHGLSGLFGVPANPHGGAVAGFLEWPDWWASVIQLIAGGLVVVGFGTRLAALLCSGSMAYAFLFVHLEVAILPIQNGGELAVLFCWSFFLIAALGPGAFALRDARPRPRTARRAVVPQRRS